MAGPRPKLILLVTLLAGLAALLSGCTTPSEGTDTNQSLSSAPLSGIVSTNDSTYTADILIKDERSGVPIPNAEVEVQIDGGRAGFFSGTWMTDAQGIARVQLPGNLQNYPALFTVRAENYHDGRDRIGTISPFSMPGTIGLFAASEAAPSGEDLLLIEEQPEADETLDDPAFELEPTPEP